MTLRSPFADPVTRDIVDGVWMDPSGSPDLHLGGDSWALPGLCDAHAHLAGVRLDDAGDPAGVVKRARAALEAGLTLILDKGWRDMTTIEAVSGLPEVERPEIEAAARLISVEGGYYPDFGLVVEPEQLSGSVATEAERGVGWVKVVGDWPRKGRGPVANFDMSQLAGAVAAATEAGSKVAIHTMAPEVPSMAVAAGVHSIEHGLFLSEDDLGDLGQRGGMWVPTISRVEETIGHLGPDSSGGRLLAEGLDNVRSLLALGVEAGVHVLAGTDLVGTPADVASEARKLAECGLTNDQAVQAVGGSAFKATGRSVDFAPGEPANAVLFPADPTEDLGVLDAPSAVIRLGVIL